MPSRNIGTSAPSARPCVPLSRSCRYSSTATLPVVAGGRERQGWEGKTAAAANAEMIPIFLRDAAAMGQRGQRRRAATQALPRPHVNSINNGGGGCSGAPCLLLSSLAAAVAWGRRHGDNGNNKDDNGNNSMHSDSGEHSGDGDGKGTPPQTPPLSLPTQLLVLACFVILCLLLF
jgi:hypothetical protein